MSEKKTRKKRGERPDGRIQVTYTDGRKPDGKPNRISFYGRTRSEAEAKRDQYIKDKDAGFVYLYKSITVSEWIDKMEKLYEPFPTKDHGYVQRLKNDYGKIKMSDIREAHLVRSLRQGFEGKSTGAAMQYRSIIKRVFSRAYKNGVITADPSYDLQLPKTKSGTHRALTRGEIELICRTWEEHPVGLWAMLMVMCGLRRGEMIALRWENVDMVKRTIFVCENAVFRHNGNKGTVINDYTKTPAGIRTVPMCAPLAQILDAVPFEERTGFVCKGSSGGAITEADFERGWRNYKKMLSTYSGTVSNIRAHDLRHTFATLLYDAGVDIKSAQYFLGHTTPQVTMQIYTHLSEEKAKQSAAQLGEYLDMISADFKP